MRSIWIYGAAEPFTAHQEAQIKQGLQAFLANWKAHGAPVTGDAETMHGRFVILRAQKGDTSGCSIDSMNRSVTEILQKAGAKVLESNWIFYRAPGGHIETIDFREVESAITAGKMGPDTPIFDNSLQDRDDFGRWEVPLAQSWLSRYAPA